MVRLRKFSFAAIVAASLACTPAMAEAIDSPVFTEKIECVALDNNSVGATEAVNVAFKDVVAKSSNPMVFLAVIRGITQNPAMTAEQVLLTKGSVNTQTTGHYFRPLDTT